MLLLKLVITTILYKAVITISNKKRILKNNPCANLIFKHLLHNLRQIFKHCMLKRNLLKQNNIVTKLDNKYLKNKIKKRKKIS